MTTKLLMQWCYCAEIKLKHNQLYHRLSFGMEAFFDSNSSGMKWIITVPVKFGRSMLPKIIGGDVHLRYFQIARYISATSKWWVDGVLRIWGEETNLHEALNVFYKFINQTCTRRSTCSTISSIITVEAWTSCALCHRPPYETTSSSGGFCFRNHFF